MRRMSTSNSNSRGFTLVEMLVVAPIVLLATAGFIAVMVNMVGDVMVTRERNALLFETQDGLNQVEQDIRLSTEFRVSTGTLPSPQGSNNNFTGTAAFTSTNSLIMATLATDKNPLDTTRQLIYYANQPNVCGADKSYNRVFLNRVVYFVKDGSLWRRTILPPYNTNVTVDDNTVCNSPWQRNTCSPGYTTSPPCQTNDTELIKNVTAFTVKYYPDNNSTTELDPAEVDAASAIEASVTTSKQVGGRTVTYNNTVRGTKLNSISVDLPLPTDPSLSYSITAPTTSTFTWSPSNNATSYDLQYNINGGAWNNVSVNGSTTSYAVTSNHNDTITFNLTARNASGTSGTVSSTMTIPRWPTCNPGNGWGNYGAGYAPLSFTRTTTGVVEVRGMVKRNTSAPNIVLCNLPVGYRPQERLVFHAVAFRAGNSGATVGGYRQGRIDINTNGDIIYVSGIWGTADTPSSPDSWIDLSGVKFVVSGASYTWTAGTFPANWMNYSGTGGYSTLKSTIDSENRVHLQGLVSPTSYPTGTNIAAGTAVAIPTATHRPAEQSIVGTKCNNSEVFNCVLLMNSTNIAERVAVSGVQYLATQAMYYRPSFAGWTNLPMLNSWTNYNTIYGGTFSTAQYAKSANDNMVVVKGLVSKSGTATTIGGYQVIGQLPVGYRPKDRMIFHSVINANVQGSVDVLTNGDIVVRSGNTGWTSLDEISFIADQ